MKQTRNTMQREVVYEALRKLNGYHPTAQSVYEEVYKTHPNISRGTVYRNLGILSESGKILKLSMGDGVDRYDDNVTYHGHLLCDECKQMFDVFMDEPLNIKGLTQQGFKIHTQAVILTGICPDCLQLNKN